MWPAFSLTAIIPSLLCVSGVFLIVCVAEERLHLVYLNVPFVFGFPSCSQGLEIFVIISLKTLCIPLVCNLMPFSMPIDS